MAHLTLIPTPIDDKSPLEETAKKILLDACENPKAIILVEEHKACRRRWLSWGLPRETIEKFVLYNEHTRDELAPKIISDLQSGKKAYLMSDCGLPAFCDPGVNLVRMCHEHNLKVTSAPFSNSISLAMALSGIDHSRFIFEGFVSKGRERDQELKRIMKQKDVSIVMDTPYRMKKLLEELMNINPNRVGFLGMDLNKESEELHKGSLASLFKKAPDEKKEFILVLDKL